MTIPAARRPATLSSHPFDRILVHHPIPSVGCPLRVESPRCPPAAVHLRPPSLLCQQTSTVVTVFHPPDQPLSAAIDGPIALSSIHSVQLPPRKAQTAKFLPPRERARQHNNPLPPSTRRSSLDSLHLRETRVDLSLAQRHLAHGRWLPSPRLHISSPPLPSKAGPQHEDVAGDPHRGACLHRLRPRLLAYAVSLANRHRSHRSHRRPGRHLRACAYHHRRWRFVTPLHLNACDLRLTCM